jgi:hypothetical protein
MNSWYRRESYFPNLNFHDTWKISLTCWCLRGPYALRKESHVYSFWTQNLFSLVQLLDPLLPAQFVQRGRQADDTAETRERPQNGFWTCMGRGRAEEFNTITCSLLDITCRGGCFRLMCWYQGHLAETKQPNATSSRKHHRMFRLEHAAIMN